MCCMCLTLFFFSSRRRHTSCALVTGVQTCALPIFARPGDDQTRLEGEDADILDYFAKHGLAVNHVRRSRGDASSADEIMDHAAVTAANLKIGRASCRERVCAYV